MRTVAIIPARYSSTRFPGKPLADICGKPMVWWVYMEARKVLEYDDVIIATDSEEIVNECKKLNLKVMMTSDKHPTGTDRVAEVAQSIPADVYVIIMGDEPLIKAADEMRLLAALSDKKNADAVMLVEKFVNPVDLANMTTIKLAINDSGQLIYMSRAAIPYPKDSIGYSFYKNVGCYALRKETLDFYLKTQPGNLERAEGIELLRLIENQKSVQTVLINSESMSVDTPKDLERICAAIYKDSHKQALLSKD